MPGEVSVVDVGMGPSGPFLAADARKGMSESVGPADLCAAAGCGKIRRDT